jgi:hypothetical protein
LHGGDHPFKAFPPPQYPPYPFLFQIFTNVEDRGFGVADFRLKARVFRKIAFGVINGKKFAHGQ